MELFMQLKNQAYEKGFKPQTSEEAEMFEVEIKAKAFDIVLHDEQWENFENPQKQFYAYIKGRYRIYEQIKNLPNCPIVKLKGSSYTTDIYSGGTYAADPKDYSGEFPAIIMTCKSEYWRGNSKRAWTYWHLAKSPDDIELILTQAEGDYLNNQEEDDFSFEEIYYFTHNED